VTIDSNQRKENNQNDSQLFTKNHLQKIENKILEKSRELKKRKLLAMNLDGNENHFYDDDIVETISEEFTDRITVIFVIGDIIRALGGLIKNRKTLLSKNLKNLVLTKIKTDEKISRRDLANFTSIESVPENHLNPIMNGGPHGENWNKMEGGFYDWIDNKSSKFIIGVELGFKADEYGNTVSKKLIKKKLQNPNMYVGILIDGFVSIIMQKPPEKLDDFQKNTISMINDMKKVGIDVRVNDSWNPLSSDFLAANHIKLWIFDSIVAFYGGIGIESQFIKKLYDQMDLVKGPFVQVLTLQAILLFTNQKRTLFDSTDKIKQIYEMTREDIEKKFLPELTKSGNTTLKISMNIPGYIQDAQKDYIELLKHKELQEVYIMAPYFSDDKIARSLVLAANRLEKRLYAEKLKEMKLNHTHLTSEQLKIEVKKELKKSKKIHVIFPKKQENAIIAEISKYYAYHLRNNTIVETLQFYAKDGDTIHEMLHAKQLVVILENETQTWKKYVKFGGSYNPAGRAHNMWELNTIAYDGNWEQSDDANDEFNEVKDYLENVMRYVVNNYTQPFPWGQSDYKITIIEKITMKFAQLMFF